MKVQAQTLFTCPVPSIDDEPPERAGMMESLLVDADGQEELYLSFIAKAEAGETVLDLYNHYVDVQLYADGHAVVEELRRSDDDAAELGPPVRVQSTVAEVKQLILDWLSAKKEWRAQREVVRAIPDSAAVASTPAPLTAPPTNLKPTL